MGVHAMHDPMLSTSQQMALPQNGECGRACLYACVCVMSYSLGFTVGARAIHVFYVTNLALVN